jgi:hypothetical protein
LDLRQPQRRALWSTSPALGEREVERAKFFYVRHAPGGEQRRKFVAEHLRELGAGRLEEGKVTGDEREVPSSAEAFCGPEEARGAARIARRDGGGDSLKADRGVCGIAGFDA